MEGKGRGGRRRPPGQQAGGEGRGKGSPRNQTSVDSRDGSTGEGRGGEGQGLGALPSFMCGLGGLVQAPQSRRAFLKVLPAQGVVQAGGAKFL